RGNLAQRRRARAKQVHEFGAFFDQRRLERKRVRRLLERRRPALGGFFQLARDACPGLEERVLVGEEGRLLLRYGGSLRSGALERDEELAQAGGWRGEVAQHRHGVRDQRSQRRDRVVQPHAAPRQAVAEAVEVDLAGEARLFVEHVEQLV